jgi:hypothetical protein
MNSGKYEKVCYRTEQREENVLLRNLKRPNGLLFRLHHCGRDPAGKTVGWQSGFLAARGVHGNRLRTVKQPEADVYISRNGLTYISRSKQQ